MPDLRNIALTGQEMDDSRYLALTQGEGSIPQQSRPVGNDAPVKFGASGSGGGRGGGGGVHKDINTRAELRAYDPAL